MRLKAMRQIVLKDLFPYHRGWNSHYSYFERLYDHTCLNLGFVIAHRFPASWVVGIRSEQGDADSHETYGYGFLGFAILEDCRVLLS